MSKKKNNPPAKIKAKNSSPPQGKLQQASQQYPGPIPPPEVLHSFDQIIPGAAERILVMAEKNGKQQREIEKASLTLASDEVKRGQRFGLTIGILAFATCIIALILGSEKTAIALGGTTLIGLFAVFVTGHIKKS